MIRYDMHGMLVNATDASINTFSYITHAGDINTMKSIHKILDSFLIKFYKILNYNPYRDYDKH